ncbi:MAG: helix-turn-helix domain-containing protein [Pseudonocardiaceae bacterium]|nr:helix-turn-helix domain-containing protein [Pseudonocardiaceae bacterium]
MLGIERDGRGERNTVDTAGTNAKAVPHSQTLDRGIRVLEVLGDADGPLSIAQLAGELDVHRSIVYRILRTLESHRLVSRRGDGACELAPGLATLARGVSRDLRTAALPELTAAANDLGMTCFLVVPDRDECITLVSVEPRHAVAVAQRPGSRHPIEQGAPGLALLAALPAKASERDEVGQCRERGYAKSHSEVIRGLTSIAVPVPGQGEAPCAIAVVYVDTDEDAEQISARLNQATKAVAAELD